jgi:hypothetical protein
MNMHTACTVHVPELNIISMIGDAQSVMSAIDTLEQRMSGTSRRPLVDWLLWICSIFRPTNHRPRRKFGNCIVAAASPGRQVVVVILTALDADSVFDELDNNHNTLNKLKE